MLGLILLGFVTPAKAEEIIVDGKPDPGLPWTGTWTVTKIIDDYNFELTYDGYQIAYSYILTHMRCRDGDQKPAPKLYDKYVREGNQVWRPKEGKTQWLDYIEILEQKYSAHLGIVVMPPPPPCCSLCKMCYERGYVAGGEWVKVDDLGCVGFAESPTLPFLPGTINLSKPYELKARFSCSTQETPLDSWLDRFTGNKWSFWKAVLIPDGSAKINCTDLDNSTDLFRWIFSYWDRGCKCNTGIKVTDP